MVTKFEAITFYVFVSVVYYTIILKIKNNVKIGKKNIFKIIDIYRYDGV